MGTRESAGQIGTLAADGESRTPAAGEMSRPEVGCVYLVGAGPGDPGLLTARALELIATADVILHDRLIATTALDGARADAELLFVGKQGGGASVPQEQTEGLMVDRARAGKTVVRLKGGDPFVFGRGGEEALTLRAAAIPYEVVPGVTSGLAAAAYAGIPVTHRGLATAVALVTGHTRADTGRESSSEEGKTDTGRESSSEESKTDTGRESSPEDGATDTRWESSPEDGATDLDWAALAAFPGTLVFYMGVRQLPRIAASLVEEGRSPSEPVAVVERATLPDQRTVSGTLETIPELARRAQIRAPSITVVGPVAALAGRLSWLPERPLAGRTVAVTRARAQASPLARRLEALGATVVQAPAIRTQPLPVPPLDLSPYDLVCFTSPTAVAELFERVLAAATHPPRDARAFARARVAAIGPGTARALAERGLVADIVPERFVAESLVEALAEVPVEHALVARAREARDVVPDALRALGAQVDVLALYETVAEPLSPRVLASARAADYITFTSSSTVRFFLRSAGAQAALSPATRIVSIGPVTSETLREHGLEPHVSADPHDVDGLVAALLADVLSR